MYYRLVLQEDCQDKNSYHIIAGIDKFRAILDKYKFRSDITILGCESYLTLSESIKLQGVCQYEAY